MVQFVKYTQHGEFQKAFKSEQLAMCISNTAIRIIAISNIMYRIH